MSTAGRQHRITARARHPRWRLAPWVVQSSSCINCEACLRACPPEFGAVVQRRFNVVIVPELCSGCGRCAPACPVDCIVEDPEWTPAPEAWWADVTVNDEAKVEAHV